MDESKDLSLDLTGISFENAKTLLATLKYTIRPYKKNGCYYILTRDYNTHRVNVNLDENDYILDFHTG